MRDDSKSLEMARTYLRDNFELRKKLGISETAELVPRPLGMGEHNLNYWFEAESEFGIGKNTFGQATGAENLPNDTSPNRNRKYVLRINVVSQPFHINQVAYEFAALSALAPSGCTPLPYYLDARESAPAKGAMVISFCEGNELDFDHLQPNDLQHAASLMANAHSVPVSDECPLYRPENPLRSLFEECINRFEAYQSSAAENPRITKWGLTFISQAEKYLGIPSYPQDCTHIINTEPLPSHFLIPSSAGKVRDSYRAHPGYFIDWERPIIGEVAQDLAYFTAPTTTFWDSDYLFPPSEVSDFVEGYWRAVAGRFPRGNFDERFKAFRAMTALRSMTWCCRALITYGNYSNEHKTQKTVDKLPIYLSDAFIERVAAECFDL